MHQFCPCFYINPMITHIPPDCVIYQGHKILAWNMLDICSKQEVGVCIHIHPLPALYIHFLLYTYIHCLCMLDLQLVALPWFCTHDGFCVYVYVIVRMYMCHVMFCHVSVLPCTCTDSDVFIVGETPWGSPSFMQLIHTSRNADTQQSWV